MAAGPASYGMTDTLGRMHSDAQFAGSSSVPAHVEMMGLIGAGNNPMVGMTVAVAVAVEEAATRQILIENRVNDSFRDFRELPLKVPFYFEVRNVFGKVENHMKK